MVKKPGKQVHGLFMNYIITMLLLVSCMSRFNHLLHFARFCAGSSPKNSQQKHTTQKFANFSLFKTLPKPNSLWPKKHKGCREPIKLQTNS